MDTCCMAYTESQVRDEPLINLVRALVTPCGKALPAVSVVPTLSKKQKTRRNMKATVEKAVVKPDVTSNTVVHKDILCVGAIRSPSQRADKQLGQQRSVLKVDGRYKGKCQVFGE